MFTAIVADLYYDSSSSVGFLLSGIMILYNDESSQERDGRTNFMDYIVNYTPSIFAVIGYLVLKTMYICVAEVSLGRT